MKPGSIDLIVSSPPFLDGQPLGNPADSYKGFEHVGSVKRGQDGYGVTKGQLGAMKPGTPFGKQKMKKTKKASWKVSTWAGCYDESWKGIITDASFAHPAKMARGLVKRIFKHLKENYGLKKNSVCVDPFGGIGSTGIQGTKEECQCFLVELEPRFVKMAKKNFKIHKRTWKLQGRALPVIVQGDSRRLREVLGPVLADVCVSSPPYTEAQTSNEHSQKQKASGYFAKSTNGTLTGSYAEVPMTSPGQLGSMKSGDVDAIISSPPFQESGATLNVEGHRRQVTADRAKRKGAKVYGTSKGQLADMPAGKVDAIINQRRGGECQFAKTAERRLVAKLRKRDVDLATVEASLGCSKGKSSHQNTSQRSLLQIQAGDTPKKRKGKSAKNDLEHKKAKIQNTTTSGGSASGESENESLHSTVTNAPFVDSLDRGFQSTTSKTNRKRGASGTTGMKISGFFAEPVTHDCTQQKNSIALNVERRMSASESKAREPVLRNADDEGSTDNIKNASPEKQETFWSASVQILRECHKILRPGGIAVFVCKNFVRKGRLVEFSEQWRSVCEFVGFETVEWVRASLVTEWKKPTFFGEQIEEKARKSFFRRLAENKARQKKYWESLTPEERKAFRKQVREKNPDLAKSKRIAKAQEMALAAYKGDASQFDGETKINHEDCLFLRKKNA